MENTKVEEWLDKNNLLCVYVGGSGVCRARGDHEHLKDTGNPGNFLATMKLIANHDKKISEHLEKPRYKNAVYIFVSTDTE